MRQNVKSPRPTLAVASHGGHWVQLMRMRPAYESGGVVYASTEFGLKEAYGIESFELLPDANLTSKLRLLLLFISSLILIIKVRPSCVITTGAAPGFACIVVAKLFFIKTIWVDSIANADDLSAAGKFAKYFSTYWLTQWPEVAEKYEGLEYVGNVL